MNIDNITKIIKRMFSDYRNGKGYSVLMDNVEQLNLEGNAEKAIKIQEDFQKHQFLIKKENERKRNLAIAIQNNKPQVKVVDVKSDIQYTKVIKFYVSNGWDLQSDIGKNRTDLSGGKIAGAALTGGLSLLVTGITKEKNKGHRKIVFVKKGVPIDQNLYTPFL
jgi:hypothetical protein